MNEHESCEQEIEELKNLLREIRETLADGWYTRQDANCIKFDRLIARIDYYI